MAPTLPRWGGQTKATAIEYSVVAICPLVESSWRLSPQEKAAQVRRPPNKSEQVTISTDAQITIENGEMWKRKQSEPRNSSSITEAKDSEVVAHQRIQMSSF